MHGPFEQATLPARVGLVQHRDFAFTDDGKYLNLVGTLGPGLWIVCGGGGKSWVSVALRIEDYYEQGHEVTLIITEPNISLPDEVNSTICGFRSFSTNSG